MIDDDLRHLLRSADGGDARPDHEEIARRGRRLTRRRTSVVAAAVAVVAVGIVGTAVTTWSGDDPTPVITDPEPTTPEPADPTPDTTDPAPEERNGEAADEPTEVAVPSQSAADAERDGVFAEVAALPFEVRVGPVDVVPDARTRIAADEGVWIVSRPDLNAMEPDDWRVGDATGLYGRDMVDLAGYGEVLLLDADETRILRAYPFHDLAPGALLLTDDAVYCARQGDGGLPDSMLCRIDRTSLAATARVFPGSDESQFLDPTETYVPDHWVVEDPLGEALFGDLQVIDGELTSVGQAHHTVFDPVTLELRLDDLASPDMSTQDERLIADLLALADDPSPVTAGALPFADEVQLGLGPELHQTRSFDELGDPAAWVIDVEIFRAYVGPFSALDLASDAGGVVISVGEHPHCASPPEPAPQEVADLRRVSVQPDPQPDDSCLQWWTVDLFVDDDGRIVAVTMDLWEP